MTTHYAAREYGFYASGTYQNANEVIEHSLVALQAEQDKKEALRMAIKEGEESGISEGFNFSDFRKEMTDKYKK